jgi:hypothetical protein
LRIVNLGGVCFIKLVENTAEMVFKLSEEVTVQGKHIFNRDFHGWVFYLFINCARLISMLGSDIIDSPK